MKYFGELVKPMIAKNEVDELLQTLHPRFLFIKRLKRNATILDMGAGEGGVINYKHWLSPKRGDLKFYAYSLEKGELFDQYDDYEIGLWPDVKPFENRQFDAIFCSHFIEHIDDQSEFLAYCYSRLNPGGQAYLEFPSEHSLSCPTNSELKEDGVDVFIGNFYDDGTHVQVPDWSVISSTVCELGFSIQEQGIVKIPLLENEIPANRKLHDNKFAMQVAYWSKSNWCRYTILAKPGN